MIRHYLRILFYYIPKLAFVFSGSSISKFLNLLFGLWCFVIHQRVFPDTTNKYFTFLYKGKEFSLVLVSSVDIAVLAEVFVLKEYEWNLENTQIKTILDLGAHWGDSSIYYALSYPEAKIYAVEPDPDSFSRLCEVAKQFTNIIPIHAALGNADGKGVLFTSKSSLGNSLVSRKGFDDEIMVNVYSFKKILKTVGIEKFDLVKFDIEGGEEHIFRDEDVKKYTNNFIGEIHLDLMNDISLDHIGKYFYEYDLSLNKINVNRYIIKAKSV